MNTVIYFGIPTALKRLQSRTIEILKEKLELLKYLKALQAIKALCTQIIMGIWLNL